MNLDVCLVTPPNRNQVYQGLSTNLAALEPPVWSGLIAQLLLNRGYSVRMIDGEARGLSFDQTAQEIVDVGATLTVFVIYGQQPSASTQCMPGGREVCKRVNELKPGMHTAVMGTHSSALPERTLTEEPYRYVIEGEGPATILSLIEVLKGSSAPNLKLVPGLWYRDSGTVQHNAPATKIKESELDATLPRQAWELLDMSLYRAHNWHCFDDINHRQPYASLQTSLGCPYKCSFCCINAPFGGAGIRYWSPDNIIGQIEILVEKYGVRNIKIPDEMFVLNEKHVLGICDRIIERGYNLNIWAYARVDTVKEKFLEKLKRAGFTWLALGIESGSKHVRDGVEKGRFGDTDIHRVVKMIQDSGISIIANYIFGLPDDTFESMQETLDMALHFNTEWANFYSAMAYPGSPLFKHAIEKGWKLPDDWSGYSQHAVNSLPLPTDSLTGGEVLAFRDHAFDTYFSNPSFLSMIQSRFGDSVVSHIKEMSTTKLERRYAVKRVK